MDNDTIERLKQRLYQRLMALDVAITAERGRLTDAAEHEVEYEERAQKSSLVDDAQEEDKLAFEEQRLIKEALGRIDLGTYGLCANCGEEISLKRLKALPWAGECIRCASEREGVEPPSPDAPLTPGEEAPAERTPEEKNLIHTVLEALRQDGRVEMDELDVDAEGGTVLLSGFIPSPEKREIIMEVLHDELAMEDIVDELRVDRTLWARNDRSPGRQPFERPDIDTVLEGEPLEEDFQQAAKDGTSVTPPDSFRVDEE